ncbi:UBP29 hydrolase, partial [Polypterus senegalus]|nr:UBP29 hydrolase [Polypterus senegalus]
MDFELWRTVCVKCVYLLYNSQPEEVVLYATFALLFLATIMLFAGWARRLTGMPHAMFWESRELSLELLQQQSRICAIQKKLHKELQALDLQHRSQLRLIRGQIHNKNAELLQCIRRRILRAVRKQSHALCHGKADEMPEEASNVNEVVKSDKASAMSGPQSTSSAVPPLHLSGNFAFLLDMKDSHSIDEKRKLLLAIKKNVSSQDPTFAGNRQNVRKCGDITVRQEQVNHLSVSVLPGRSLQESLDLFFKSEDVESTCRCCRSNSTSLQSAFQSLPRSFDGMSDNDILETVMDISLWECISGSDKDAHQGSLGRDSVSFSLVAVLSHIGDSSYSGHYLCDAFNEKVQAWVTYDDLSVTITKKPLIQDAWATTTYIAFYLRK